ncbi:phage tail protein [Altererythrobacter sp. ZODW24]|uniref:phage tail protein n=1 Tax=Altererythrobacter sp. ZODW24 TaxID=2185142 RepID=UPI000DF782CD|nr:phage tail protein [Altererythrobacter sp. ZODW24]
MATLVLSAVGTLIGGPIGGALGSLIGGQVDNSLFGPSDKEGPRLKELSVTTSNYGQTVPQHFGRMRAGGTIIWSTELQESRQKIGGGKGQPKTTSYSYSASFAVALASRPIERLGRIWADGNLLRGSAGDLKVGGILRVYLGYGNQPQDPLMVSAIGNECPAFRGLAYAVFEDLQLGDFGNRILALTFEIIAPDGEIQLAELVGTAGLEIDTPVSFPKLAGFSNDGGGLIGSLNAIDSVYPLVADAGGNVLSLTYRDQALSPSVTLPQPTATFDVDSFGQADGRNRERQTGDAPRPGILRYYDTARDFQPGLQRAEGQARPGRERSIDFPGALDPSDARALANGAAQRADWGQDSLRWRVAELDPAIRPGSVVRAPGETGNWRVATWEWRDGGIELELIKVAPFPLASSPGDAGSPALPIDQLNLPTMLMAFALPSLGGVTSDTPALFAAASAAGPQWKGASLYFEDFGKLVEIGQTGSNRSTIGSLAAPLSSSSSLLIEQNAELIVDLVADDLALDSATFDAMATGANRAFVGGEIVQFASAEALGNGQWRLCGLLRGRGGTEHLAIAGHEAGTGFALIDDTLVPLDPAVATAAPASTIAAIGLVDSEPVEAEIADPGITRRPLSPVHPGLLIEANGDRLLCWTRRARGAWDWPDQVDAPLIEEAERYQIGIGDVDAPLTEWESEAPELSINAGTFAVLSAVNSNEPIWVRQLGRFAKSPPLLLGMV